MSRLWQTLKHTWKLMSSPRELSRLEKELNNMHHEIDQQLASVDVQRAQIHAEAVERTRNLNNRMKADLAAAEHYNSQPSNRTQMTKEEEEAFKEFGIDPQDVFSRPEYVLNRLKQIDNDTDQEIMKRNKNV
eukprot:TRINITY_DN2950_c0_g1_i1.p1 TRINITY_DN2950_c0_g1~~TRINITY_DN2950_c0_g1_i1.p1  ORF type:complete len:132 (+),score=28.00 TRINITY_DN2950_c0_g1_i1:35-430(+)